MDTDDIFPPKKSMHTRTMPRAFYACRGLFVLSIFLGVCPAPRHDGRSAASSALQVVYFYLSYECAPTFLHN